MLFHSSAFLHPPQDGAGLSLQDPVLLIFFILPFPELRMHLTSTIYPYFGLSQSPATAFLWLWWACLWHSPWSSLCKIRGNSIPHKISTTFSPICSFLSSTMWALNLLFSITAFFIIFAVIFGMLCYKLAPCNGCFMGLFKARELWHLGWQTTMKHGGGRSGEKVSERKTLSEEPLTQLRKDLPPESPECTIGMTRGGPFPLSFS